MRNARWYTKALSGSFWFPIYLAYCTGLLEKYGHQTLLVDAEASGIDHETTYKKARDFKPELVVLYFTVVTLENDMEIGRKIRQITGARVVLVGPSASMDPIGTLKKTEGIDLLARGEFDYTVLEIANGVCRDNIRGLYWKGKDDSIVENLPRPLVTGKELDSFPFVTDVYRRHLDIRNYCQTAHRHPFIDLFTGRGCAWGLCTFCLWPHTLNKETVMDDPHEPQSRASGKTNVYRVRSMENVIDELKFIKKELPFVREVFIQDDVLPEDRACELSDGIIGARLRLRWSCYARPTLKYETMKLMKRSGCRTMHVGYESGSQKILNNIRKGTLIRDMERFTRDAHKAGLYIVADFMTGLPGETEETIRETIDFAVRLPMQRYTITPAMPYPGTPFYERLKRDGHMKDGRPHYPHMSWEDIVRWNKWSYKRVYLNHRFFLRMLLKPVEWYRLARSAVYAVPYMFK